MPFKLLLPTTLPLTLDVPDDVATIPYAVDAPVPVEHTDADGIVVWGNPGQQLEDSARRLPHLRWVQALAAGPDAVLSAGFGPDVVITSGRSLHDGPVAEHTLALVLAAARRLKALHFEVIADVIIATPAWSTFPAHNLRHGGYFHPRLEAGNLCSDRLNGGRKLMSLHNRIFSVGVFAVENVDI